MHGLVVFLGRHVILNTQQATDHRNASKKRVTSGFHVWCVMLPFRGAFQHARVTIRDKPLAEPPLFYALWYSRFTAGSVFEGFCTQQFGDSSDSNSKEISWFMRLIIQNDGWTWSCAVHFATSWCHQSWQPIEAVSFLLGSMKVKSKWSLCKMNLSTARQLPDFPGQRLVLLGGTWGRKRWSIWHPEDCLCIICCTLGCNLPLEVTPPKLKSKLCIMAPGWRRVRRKKMVNVWGKVVRK